jgi:UrcA family protein
MNAFKLKIAVALAALVAGAGAQAGESSAVETRSMPVEYTRAELTTEEGTTALYARLGAASRSVCGAKSAVLAELAQWQRCRAEALDRAVAEVNDARLSALHSGAVPKRMLAQTAPAAVQSGS